MNDDQYFASCELWEQLRHVAFHIQKGEPITNAERGIFVLRLHTAAQELKAALERSRKPCECGCRDTICQECGEAR